MSHPVTQSENCEGDLCQSAVLVKKRRHFGARQPRNQIVLGSVRDNQIGFERQDALEVGIDQRSHLGPGPNFRWKLVEARHAHHFVTRANREQHLGDSRDHRDDSRRPRPPLVASDSRDGERDSYEDERRDGGLQFEVAREVEETCTGYGDGSCSR